MWFWLKVRQNEFSSNEKKLLRFSRRGLNQQNRLACWSSVWKLSFMLRQQLVTDILLSAYPTPGISQSLSLLFRHNSRFFCSQAIPDACSKSKMIEKISENWCKIAIFLGENQTFYLSLSISSCCCHLKLSFCH